MLGCVLLQLVCLNAQLSLPAGTALNPVSGGDQFKCEICMLVAQGREEHQAQASSRAGGECSGAGMEMFRETCVEVLRSFELWSKWISMWLTDLGCHKVGPNGLALARPCPGHAVCSWITSPIDRQPFCAADFSYRSPAPLPPREAERDSRASQPTTLVEARLSSPQYSRA